MKTGAVSREFAAIDRRETLVPSAEKCLWRGEGAKRRWVWEGDAGLRRKLSGLSGAAKLAVPWGWCGEEAGGWL